MNLSRDKYTLYGTKPLTAIVETLASNTLLKKTLVRETTKMPFIGQVNKEGFSLIGSSRLGVLCTSKGTFENNEQGVEVKIETKLTKAFIILFYIWTIFVIGATLFAYITNPETKFSVSNLFVLLLLVTAARFLLHSGYINARNKAVDEIRKMLE